MTAEERRQVGLLRIACERETDFRRAARLETGGEIPESEWRRMARDAARSDARGRLIRMALAAGAARVAEAVIESLDRLEAER